MERLVRGHASGLALVVALVALLALVLLLAPGAAGPNAAFAQYAGVGVTATPDQQLTEGWYEVSWKARAGDRPEQGCLFGLRIEERRSEASPDIREQLLFFWPVNGNFVYRTLPRRSSLSGSSGPVWLEAGIYGFVVDGWCGWDISLAQVPARSMPSTYGGPRM